MLLRETTSDVAVSYPLSETASRLIRSGYRLNQHYVVSCQPDWKDYFIADSGTPGLVLIVTTNGRKSWELQLPDAESANLIALGDCDDMSLQTARSLTRSLTRFQQPRGKPRGTTLRDFLRRFRRYRYAHWKPSTQRSFESYESRLVRAFGDRRIAGLRRSEVARWFADYSATSPGAANEALARLRALINYARKWGYVREDLANPCCGIRKNRRPPSGCLINEAGMGALGKALTQLPARDRTASLVIKLLATTGCRPGEIRGLMWTEIMLNDHRPFQLRLRDSKVGPRVIPIGPPAQELLAALPRHGKNPLVFPARRNPRRFIGEQVVHRVWHKVLKRAGLPPTLRLYDLRHTFASNAILQGITMYVTGALLGHRRQTTTARYTHLLTSELLEVGKHISDLISTWLGWPFEPVSASETSRWR